MRRYNKTRKQKRGGAEIGKGRFGTTFFPALTCENADEQPTDPSLVSKLMPSREARTEWMRTKPVREKNYDFACAPVSVCKSTEVHNQWLLFSKYCGKPVGEYVRHFHQEAARFAAFIHALKSLRQQVENMNKTDKIFHNDIGASNVLYDEENTKAYLIDFGDMTVEKNISNGDFPDLHLFDQMMVHALNQVYTPLKEWGVGQEEWNMLQEFLRGPATDNSNNERFRN
jgi:serine/threonine protein kinase